MSIVSYVRKGGEEYLSLLILFLVISPFLLLCLYVHPSFLDDYCFAIKTLDMGLLDAFLEWYNYWTGRYSLCFLMSLNPLVVQSYFLYKALIFLLIAALPLLIYLLIKKVLPQQSRLVYIQWTTLFGVLYFAQLPSVNEGLYWMTGALAYQLSSVCLVCLFIFLILLFEKSTKHFLYLFSCCILMVVIIGTNEISMATLLVFIGGFFLLKTNKTRRERMSLIVLLVVAVVCVAAVILAPGNGIRTGFFPEAQQLPLAIKMTVLGMGYYVSKWLGITGLIIVLGLYAMRNVDMKNFLFSTLKPSISLLLFVVVLTVGFFVPAWGTGQMPNPRAINVLYFIFVIGILYHVIAFSFLWEIEKIGKRTACIIAVALIFLLFFSNESSNNIRIAYKDLLSGKAARYDKKMYTMYAQKKMYRLAQDDIPISISNTNEDMREELLDCPEQYLKKY